MKRGGVQEKGGSGPPDPPSGHAYANRSFYTIFIVQIHDGRSFQQSNRLKIHVVMGQARVSHAEVRWQVAQW